MLKKSTIYNKPVRTAKEYQITKRNKVSRYRKKKIIILLAATFIIPITRRERCYVGPRIVPRSNE